MPESKQAQNEMLEAAVGDLLSELRIDPYSLELMAHGYSPDHPGVPLPTDTKTECRAGWRSPQPKVQISQVTAQKLFMGLGLNNKRK